MAQYKIISDKTSLGAVGTVVDAEALEGLNIDALIVGGHIEAVSTKAPKTDFKESDK